MPMVLGKREVTIINQGSATGKGESGFGSSRGKFTPRGRVTDATGNRIFEKYAHLLPPSWGTGWYIPLDTFYYLFVLETFLPLRRRLCHRQKAKNLVLAESECHCRIISLKALLSVVYSDRLLICRPTSCLLVPSTESRRLRRVFQPSNGCQRIWSMRQSL